MFFYLYFFSYFLITSQWPPFAGPILLMIPFSFNLARFHSIPLLVSPAISASSFWDKSWGQASQFHIFINFPNWFDNKIIFLDILWTCEAWPPLSYLTPAHQALVRVRCTICSIFASLTIRVYSIFFLPFIARALDKSHNNHYHYRQMYFLL